MHRFLVVPRSGVSCTLRGEIVGFMHLARLLRGHFADWTGSGSRCVGLLVYLRVRRSPEVIMAMLRCFNVKIIAGAHFIFLRVLRGLVSVPFFLIRIFRREIAIVSLRALQMKRELDPSMCSSVRAFFSFKL